MNHRYRQFPAGNPLANILVVVVGALAIGVSVVLGVVAFVVLAGIVLVLAALLSVRAWWLNRRLRRQYFSGATREQQRPENAQIVEGEFHVIQSDEDTETPGRGQGP